MSYKLTMWYADSAPLASPPKDRYRAAGPGFRRISIAQDWSMPEFFVPFCNLVNLIVSFLLHVDRHLFELVEAYGTVTYVILFAIVFCETGLVVTPFLPGDSLLFACGALAGAGKLGILPLMGVIWIAAISGDAVNYAIGNYLGPPVFQRNYRLLNQKHLRKAQEFYERHGGKAIILARFVPIVRTFAPFVAGVASMTPSRFFFFNVTGGTAWVGLITPAGYFLGNTPFVQKNFSLLVYAIIVVSCLPIVVEFVRAYWKGKNTER